MWKWVCVESGELQRGHQRGEEALRGGVGCMRYGSARQRLSGNIKKGKVDREESPCDREGKLSVGKAWKADT